MKNFSLTAIGLALLALASAASAQSTSDIGKITVTGEGDKLGTGLLIDEDTPKAKSTVTKAQIEKMRPSSNPYQNLSLLPGVNSSSYDATGLFGGNMRVRGFNSDQMGFTINGAPVNDSGSFSVFPQEYSDSENLCEIFITQGATDTEAPHIGASGGNVGLSTCGASDTAGGKVSVSAGQLSFGRVFLRGDTGKIGNFKGFLSASQAKVNKWKGEGKADRNHIDAGAEYVVANVKLSGSLLYNKAVTNNFRTLTLGELATYGFNADFATSPPQHQTPVAGVGQTEAAPPFPANASPAYYGYSLNPFENYLITTKANIQINPALRLDIEPYYWYGYGTGGTQQTTVTEGLGANRLHGGIGDVNGDGDALDKVLVYRGSVTKTNRPGVTVKASYTLDNQRILGGVWFERARHRQTAPATTIDNNGNIGDLWLRSDASLLHYADGALYQNRDVLTISTGKSAFVTDTIDLLNSKLQLVPGLSWRSIQRDFTNYASSGSNAAVTTTANFSTAAPYQISKTYSQVLPSLAASYQVSPEVQGFASISKNFKAPGNFEYFNLANGVTIVNGVGTAASIAPLTVDAETSVNLDAGVRYKTDLFKASATAFLVKFKNRIASGFDPVTASTHDYNVGDSTVKGLELEAGTAPYKGFSAYVSVTYTRSTIDNDIPATSTTFYPTSGVQFPDTPKGMAALSLQYSQGPFLANLAGKYTSRRLITLVGDQSLPGFTTIDLNAAYQLPVLGPFKKPVVRLNVSNLTNKEYLLANAGSGSSISINAANNPSVYGGAPRFTSLTLGSDF
jgi:iron complex outermembrane receptor protein